MELPKRKPNRLKGFDYRESRAYFVTICTFQRRNILSSICVGQGLAPAENRLSVFGMAADTQIASLEQRYKQIKVAKYVIMPNHIHMIIELGGGEAAGASPCPTLSDVICTLKSLTARVCKQIDHGLGKVFQNSFYDHIIRNDEDYKEIWEYIDSNPARWAEDRFYSEILNIEK